MNDNVIEVIEIIDDSLSEIYEDITEPETTPFRVTSPLTMPIHDRYCQTNLSQSSDKENVEKPETSIQKNRIIAQEIISKHKLDHEKNKVKKVESPNKNEIFPNYNKKIQDTIIRLMSGPQNEYIMKEKHNIKKSDLLTVYSPTAWLNDEIINHYLRMIVDRDYDNLHFFDTFFYLKLS
jgi:sentrin-specific protease 1